MRHILQPNGVVISSELFREEFYKKYFPISVRNGKELELLQLKQGQMTVTEYTSKFEELCRFSRICQGAPEDFAGWKCIKYEGGLRGDIQSFVAPMEIRTFSKLVNKTRVAEECLRKAALDKSDHQSSIREDHGRNLVPRGQDFKRGGNTPQQHQGQSSFWRFNNNNNQGKERGKQAQFPQDDLTCRRCGRYHPNTPCRADWDVCYYCGRAGNMS
ncbi:uncharacterized protein LOC130980717 [Arachis stenosperma]|uniref:uncharacterized protein LOC130980717 n=1 Tax=Arachis stenosperma TaxID=217475 RepID=UPI0025AC581C|nr:uncharacterized protein LOC130980717 [Arachis stenosperma]